MRPSACLSPLDFKWREECICAETEKMIPDLRELPQLVDMYLQTQWTHLGIVLTPILHYLALWLVNWYLKPDSMSWLDSYLLEC